MEDEIISVVEESAKAYNIRHRCFYFSKDIISFIQECKYAKIYYPLFDQLLRSATSIGANVVEGSAGSSKKDFLNYYSIALKSSNETKYWLCLIRDTLFPDNNSIQMLLKEADEISRIVASIMLSAKKS